MAARCLALWISSLDGEMMTLLRISLASRDGLRDELPELGARS